MSGGAIAIVLVLRLRSFATQRRDFGLVAQSFWAKSGGGSARFLANLLNAHALRPKSRTISAAFAAYFRAICALILLTAFRAQLLNDGVAVE